MSIPVPIDAIPAEFRERYVELIEIVDQFCETYLNDEYREACYRLAAEMCIEDSPIRSGKAKSWAAGLIWAVGRVNFLSDPSFEPTMTQKEFAQAIGVSPATISAKSGGIMDSLELMPLDPRYTIDSRLADNPMVWMIEVNGMIVDLRHVPREIQEAAFEQGIIPYIPADAEKE